MQGTPSAAHIPGRAPPHPWGAAGTGGAPSHGAAASAAACCCCSRGARYHPLLGSTQGAGAPEGTPQCLGQVRGPGYDHLRDKSNRSGQYFASIFDLVSTGSVSAGCKRSCQTQLVLKKRRPKALQQVLH
jgi:hypothetical protein